jgi:hypothetical protein
MAAYEERFSKGSRVRVAARETLSLFQRTWQWHHPLTDQMLASAGREAVVESVGFYLRRSSALRIALSPEA